MSQARALYPQLRLIWADGGYAGKLIEWTLRVCGKDAVHQLLRTDGAERGSRGRIGTGTAGGTAPPFVVAIRPT